MIAMNSKHLWSVIIASEDSYDSHDQWSHMIAMNTDCEQSLFIGTAMNLDSERSMIKHIIHDEVGSMLWNAGVHTWSTLILYHIMTPRAAITELSILIEFQQFHKGSNKKKREKSGQADCLGRPRPLPPPPKRSRKCEKFSTSCHIWGYFAIL